MKRADSCRAAMSAAVISVLAMLGGCQRPSPPAVEAKAAAPETAQVKIIHPERKSVRKVIKRPGYNIEAYQSTPLYARLTGYVTKWNFDIGDRVKKDDVLVELSVPEMDIDLQHKEAAVLQAEAEVPLAQATVQRAKAEFDRTKSQSERLAKLGGSGVINRENVDEARFGFESSKATLAHAEAEVKVARAKLEVARKARDYTRAMLQYAKIRAPFNGVVTQRHVNEGDFVHPGSGKKSEALFVVEQVDPVRVFVNIPDVDAVWVRDGGSANVRVQSLPGREFKGTVTRTAKSLNPATRTLRTEIDLPNPRGELLPGMYVDVVLAIERQKVWTLPASAVTTDNDASFCYEIIDGKAISLPVQVGLRGEEFVEVISKQLQSATSAPEPPWGDFTGREEIASTAAALKNGQAVTMSRTEK